MELELVTGFRGREHVTAEQLGDLQGGFAGYKQCVLPIGERFRAEAVTANKIRIFDGTLLFYGRQAMIEAGAYVDVVIENGSQGLLRNDFIIGRYKKDDTTGYETMEFSVIKGSTGDTAVDPIPLDQSIRDGAFESEMSMFRVRLNGLAIEAVEPLFNVLLSAKEVNEGLHDSGWIDVKKFGHGVSQSAAVQKSVQYRRIGNRVITRGKIQVASMDFNTLLFNLPIGYRPTTSEHQLTTATGNRFGRMALPSNGNLSLEWVKNIADGSDMTGKEITWADVGMDFFVD